MADHSQQLEEAQQLGAQNRIQEALSVCTGILQETPDCVEALCLLGFLSHRIQDYDRAAECLRRASELRRTDPQLHTNLGAVLQTQGNLAEAIRHLEEASRLDPNNPERLNVLGVMLLNSQRLKAAVGRFRDALRLKPDFVLARYNLGLALEKMGACDEAAEELREALRLQPANAGLLFALGSALNSQGKFEEAVSPLEKAVRHQPEHAEAHAALGFALHATDRLDEALAHYHKALALQPDDPALLNNLGSLLQTYRQQRSQPDVDLPPFDETEGPPGPAVLVTSIPKSGTYFAGALLKHLGFRDLGIHINFDHYVVLRDMGEDLIIPFPAAFSLQRLRPGQFATSHLPCDPELEKAALRSNLKILFLHRDPRDCVTSYLRFVMTERYVEKGGKPARQLQEYLMNEHPDDHSRLGSIMEHYYSPEMLSASVRWMEAPCAIPLGFEDFLEEIQLCREKRIIGEKLGRVIKALGVPPEELDPLELHESVYGKGRTFSSKARKVGQHREYFSPEHFKRFEAPDYREVMERLGYG